MIVFYLWPLRKSFLLESAILAETIWVHNRHELIWIIAEPNTAVVILSQLYIIYPSEGWSTLRPPFFDPPFSPIHPSGGWSTIRPPFFDSSCIRVVHTKIISQIYLFLMCFNSLKQLLHTDKWFIIFVSFKHTLTKKNQLIFCVFNLALFYIFFLCGKRPCLCGESFSSSNFC